MTRSPMLTTLVLAALLALQGNRASADDVRAAVEAGNRAFIAAFLAGDTRAVAELDTEDARVVPPGSPVASGRAEIEAFWRGMIQKGYEDVKLETAEVESAGDLAVEDGTVRLVTADGTAGESRYIVMWKRVGGRWKVHRDIWN